MEIRNKATRIRLFDFKTPQMRAFHLSWFAFHVCFFGWFGIAPMMAVVRDDLNLTKTQIGNTMIASVAVTVVVRLFIGLLCDRIGPRRTYTWLLCLGALPVMSIGLADSFESFLLARLAIGAIGASLRSCSVPTWWARPMRPRPAGAIWGEERLRFSCLWYCQGF
nr:MFS transporter [uncultured Kushneria sp.]